MNFTPTPRGTEMLGRVDRFMREHIEPNEAKLLTAAAAGGEQPLLAALRKRARDAGLWNLFLNDAEWGPGLSYCEYAPLAERMGRVAAAAEIFNCQAPDSGNIEVLAAHGDAPQKEKWLKPLLAGEIRSAFAMTEPDVASSDATNIAATIAFDGNDIILDGHKWWTTGIAHPECRLLLFLGLSDPEGPHHRRHSIALVPYPCPGVRVVRLLSTMGYEDAAQGHGEVQFDRVRLPQSALLGAPGDGFAIAQSRLGPGRIHHCMRLIGVAERALELACKRALGRIAFGRPLAELGGNRQRLGWARCAIDQARLLVLHAAWRLDREGARGARDEISAIKAVVPQMAQEVIDLAIQLHGGAGLAEDLPLAAFWTQARALRIADGPDEVHLDLLGRRELKKHAATPAAAPPGQSGD